MTVYSAIVRMAIRILAWACILQIAFALLGWWAIENSFGDVAPHSLDRVLKISIPQNVSGLLSRWKLASFGLLGTLASAYLFLSLVRDQTSLRRRLGTAAPESVATIRIVVTAILILTLLGEDLASTAYFPDEFRRDFSYSRIGILKWVAMVPAFSKLLGSFTALSTLKYITIISLAFSLIGFRVRLFLPLSACGVLLFRGILQHYSHFYHSGLVAFYVLVVLSFLRCADAWSVDRFLNARRGSDSVGHIPQSEYYAFARMACWVPIAASYFWCGASKLINSNGSWWDATNLRTYILADSLNPMDVDIETGLLFASYPDWVLSTVAVATLFIETGYILILFGATWRIILPVAALLMHIGILVAQKILFLDLILLPAIFIDWHCLFERLTRHFFPHKQTLVDTSPIVSSSAGPALTTSPPSALTLAATANIGTLTQEPLDRAIASELWNWTPRSKAIHVLSLTLCYLVLMGFGWTRFEFFPLSSWQMYSFKLNEVQYYSIFAIHSDGSRSSFKLGNNIQLLGDARGLDHIPFLFAYGDAARTHRKLFQIVIDLWNASHVDAFPIESIQVECRRFKVLGRHNWSPKDSCGTVTIDRVAKGGIR